MVTLDPVRDVHVRLVAQGPLGWDELRVVCFAVAGVIGTLAGVWLAGFIS